MDIALAGLLIRVGSSVNRSRQSQKSRKAPTGKHSPSGWTVEDISFMERRKGYEVIDETHKKLHRTVQGTCLGPTTDRWAKGLGLGRSAQQARLGGTGRTVQFQEDVLSKEVTRAGSGT